MPNTHISYYHCNTITETLRKGNTQAGTTASTKIVVNLIGNLPSIPPPHNQPPLHHRSKIISTVVFTNKPSPLTAFNSLARRHCTVAIPSHPSIQLLIPNSAKDTTFVMSPTSPVYRVDGEFRNGGHSSALKLPSTFPFGIRTKPPKHPEKLSVSALKVCKDSHRIRKPPLPLPKVQYRAPVIIHTYSPKVIHTAPDDFMSLVQQLTGSSDTRLRLKRKPSKKSARKASPKPAPDLPQGNDDLNCASPSSSQDSEVFVPKSKSVKQSNSPRGPLSNFEFDAEVKPEPESSFNFFTGLKPLPKPPSGESGFSHYSYQGIEINSPLPSPGFLSPGWLPELSPGTAAWSQTFLDCLNGSPRLAEQPPLQRQKAYSSGYSPKPSEGTMVALESIHAFMMK